MNEYDSARMADLLGESYDMELTSVPEDADILLLNTCSIREKAQEKVFHQLGRWKLLKDDNPDSQGESESMTQSDAIGALMKMKGLDTSEMKTDGSGEQSSTDDDSSESNSSTKKDEQN